MQITIPLGLGIFLIWYIYQSFTPTQLEQTKKYFSDANYGFVAISVVLSILSHIIRAHRWNLMLEPLGYKTKLVNNFMAISVAYLMNIFIPKSGEVSRAIVLDKYEDVPFQKGFGTIISERIVDLIFLLVFTIIALIIQFDILYEFVLERIPTYALYILLLGILVIGILIPAYIVFSQSNINRKLKDFIIGLKEGIFSILTMRRKASFFAQSLIIWSLYLLSFYTALQSLPETSVIPIGTAIIAFVVGSFTIAFTNSGFGTYPAAMAGILTIFGIVKTAGVAFGWIVWVSNISSIILFGIISLVLLPVYNKPTNRT
ncbi:flippase-like domain-containing protein [Aequorivita sp. H23M31]|uniref:Flippase-like domain-containing protein n=1 Tax=Aequorivita ciconiae TaxID=2494375 RepID=A0A410G7G5_9FLAO|nr:flippase-like domain-containing protein [Aequorivita sp. H23M31]